MAKVVGPSGIVAVVDDSVASSLVNGGYVEYVKDAPKREETPAKKSK